VNHVNEVIEKLFDLSDNGGSMYFPSIVAHGVTRLMFSYLQELYGGTGSLLTFDQWSFLSGLGQNSWNDEGKSNPAVIFTNGGQSYRSYYPDNSAGFSKAGYLSTVKMDAINNNEKDDYLSLLTTFDPTGKLFSVQGTIDIYGAPDDSDDDDKYTAPTSGTIAYDKTGKVVQITKTSINPLPQYTTVAAAYKDLMQSAFDNVQYVDKDDFSASLKNLVNASCEVLQAIEDAVK